MAASLQRFAKSAPLKPNVSVAILLEYSSKVWLGDSLIFFK